MEWNILKDNQASSLFQRIRWRLRYTKVRRFHLNGFVNHCDSCDVRSEHYGAACITYYCPCNASQSLKLKKKKKNEKT